MEIIVIINLTGKLLKSLYILISALTASVFLGVTKKNEKCGKPPYIHDVHTERGWEVLKVVTCLWILLLLSNRSIVDFCGCRGWEGNNIDAFCGYHKCKITELVIDYDVQISRIKK